MAFNKGRITKPASALGKPDNQYPLQKAAPTKPPKEAREQERQKIMSNHHKEMIAALVLDAATISFTSGLALMVVLAAVA
ncbi:hypothetical protein Brsp05_04525 [Brucella sp. NBRC 12953]|uniref:hypothetical protein n=1 Tax=Brucella sp. NBRC 12953 TaxID=3075481 RepID=UPI00309BAE9A